MTIKQLPDFAFRSATDYASALDDLHARYDPLLGSGVVDVLERLSVFSIFRSPVVQRRAGGPGDLDRGLHPGSDAEAVAGRARGPGRPARAVLRSAPAGPGGDVRRLRRGRPIGAATKRPARARGDASRRHALPVRRSPPVHEAGDAADPRRPGHLPGRRRRHLAARRRAGPGRPGGQLAHRPADRDAGPAAGQEPRLRGTRASTPARRPTSRPTSPSTRMARRSRARRSGSTIRCRWPATRSTRTASGRRRTWSSAMRPARRCGTARCR